MLQEVAGSIKKSHYLCRRIAQMGSTDIMTFKKTIELDVLQIAALSACLTSSILEETARAYRLDAHGDHNEETLAHVRQLKKIYQALQNARWQDGELN